jgi:serine protease AprX
MRYELPTGRTADRRTSVLLALALAAATGLSAAPAQSPDLTRVLVTSVAGDISAAASAVAAAGGRVLDTFSLIGGVSAELPAGTVLAPSYRISPDAPLQVAKAPVADEGAPVTVRGTINAPTGAGAPAGAGVTVAVVDTGVADLPQFEGRLRHVNVTGEGEGDEFGHGTFVAGLVAGGGLHPGVAPAAKLLDIRVADKNGRTSLLTVLAGLEAAADANVDVLNLSLSSGSPLPYQVDPLSQALESLWRNGVTVVVPSGNDGPDSGTVTAPGSDPVLLTVGGLDENGTPAHDDDTVAEWSGRGPAPQSVAKPDLVAPGSHLVSLRAPGSHVDRANPNSRIGTDYFRGSGTSFSTAVTSGAAAVLLSDAANTDLTPGQVKARLTGTAYPTVPGGSDAAGAGGLDLTAALAASHTGSSTGASADIPGDPAVWAAFLDALMTGDRALAGSSWSRLSLEARNWAASSWSSLSPEARNWAASSWSGRNWAGADGSADQWMARNWAARNWSARNWSGVWN